MNSKSLFSLSADKLTAQLRARGFMVKEQEGGAFLLVHPSRGKYDWEADELAFRSVALQPGDINNGAARVVSVGWPKFFNQGEWPDHDAVIAGDLEAGRAVITHKHDGSLIIRSVLPDGRILFRTRDTFDGGKFAPLAEAVARARYPALLDPTVFPQGSLLFEYVGAENQIVVRYAGEDNLILLGAVLHDGGGENDTPIRYLTYAETVPLAQAHGIQLVETYPWADEARGVAEILALVQDWDKAEGVVVRSGDGQTLLKVKSAWYFAQHALRWQVKLSTIARFCIDGGIEDEPTFARKLTEVGWDYETATIALGYFHEYQKRKQEADAIKANAILFLESFDAETADHFGDNEAGRRARRKAFAERIFGPKATPEVQALRPYLFFAYDGRFDKMEATLLRRLILASGE